MKNNNSNQMIFTLKIDKLKCKICYGFINVRKKVSNICNGCYTKYNFSIFRNFKLQIHIIFFLLENFIINTPAAVTLNLLKRANNAITLKTIYKYNKRFLFFVSENITAFMDNLRLSGTVELDETLVTKRKYNR